MGHNVLTTGGSGYLGGTLLHRLPEANLPSYDKLYALVRTDAQAQAVKQYGAEPLTFSAYDESAVRDAVLQHGINIVLFLIDAASPASQQYFIRALAELKSKTGQDVHFLHTSGAKIFSGHTGAPTDAPLFDDDPNIYNIQKTQRSNPQRMQRAVETNNVIVELSESLGVRSYIFIPCIVYGPGEGFGNTISIQTVAVVNAAKSTRCVYKVDADRPTWPVCHILDNTALYVQLLKSILLDQSPGHGTNGYYLASPGSVAWEDIYSATAKALFKRGLVDDEEVRLADDLVLDKMATALKSPKEMVAPQLGGRCTLTARRGGQIGWTPQFPADHILAALEDEVAHILENS